MKIFKNTSILGVLLFTLTLTVQAWAQDMSGVMMVVKGDIKVTGKDGKTDSAKVGRKVVSGDTIISGADSRAKIVMTDKNVINVSPDSKIVIEKYENDGKDKKNVELNVMYGKVRASVEQKYDGEKSKFNIKTPSAVAGVRGTDFMAGYSRQTKTTQVITFTGTVAVGKPGPGGLIQNPVFVQPGQMTQVGMGQAPEAPKAVPKEDLNKANSESNAEGSGNSSKDSSNGGSEKTDKKEDAKEEKKDSDKKEEPKKDEAKKDDAKKEESKKDEAKKDDVKKDEPKKEEAKKDEPKKEGGGDKQAANDNKSSDKKDRGPASEGSEPKGAAPAPAEVTTSNGGGGTGGPNNGPTGGPENNKPKGPTAMGPDIPGSPTVGGNTPVITMPPPPPAICTSCLPPPLPPLPPSNLTDIIKNTQKTRISITVTPQ